MDEPQYETYLFSPVLPLFAPSIVAPLEKGKISVNLQFAIPNLHISGKEKGNYCKLIKICLNEIWSSKIEEIKSRETDLRATFVEIAFYINENEEDYYRTIQNKSRLLVERFLGIMSFFAGAKLSARNIIPTIMHESSNKMILRVQEKTERPPINFSMPEELCNGNVVSSEVFTALFWLRRGLAERDPIDTFNAFTVCLQILANDWWDKKIASGYIPNKPAPIKCPHCKNDLLQPEKRPPISFLFREYITTELGVSRREVKEVWSLRNAIAAHGDKLDINADDFVRLTELKFNAAEWAYRGINRALGLASDTVPKPSQDFFVTDALMYLD